MGLRYPGADEVLHFSEDPTIERFLPTRAPTQRLDGVFVWACQADRCPSYWFPRDCPRTMAWVTPDTAAADRDALLGAWDVTRVHHIEYGWLDAMRSTVLYAYRLPAATFRPTDELATAMISEVEVAPLGPPEPVGDLIDAHEAAGIELRVTGNLWPWWRAVVGSTLGYSGIRLGNSRPHPIQATF